MSDDIFSSQEFEETTNKQSDQSNESSHGELTNCPHCNRKLLSVRSVMCNWCGQRIDDPEYLERAAQERARQDEREREEIAQELTMTARLGIRGYLKQQAKTPLRATPPILFPEDKTS
jgi:predicted amidophosphoribosyltransferase